MQVGRKWDFRDGPAYAESFNAFDGRKFAKLRNAVSAPTDEFGVARYADALLASSQSPRQAVLTLPSPAACVRCIRACTYARVRARAQWFVSFSWNDFAIEGATTSELYIWFIAQGVAATWHASADASIVLETDVAAVYVVRPVPVRSLGDHSGGSSKLRCAQLCVLRCLDVRVVN